MCLLVCPHGVFAPGEQVVELVAAEACMECGACQLNCPAEAIVVHSGVGCAAAMIGAALRGRSLDKANCGDAPCGGAGGQEALSSIDSEPTECG